MRIDIASISLDVKNFRHAEVFNERDALRLLLEDERKHKILGLAQDIVAQKMLDPSSRLIVTEEAGSQGKYIALEGNRRITALKTLASPELAQGLDSYPNFKTLSGSFLGLGITQVECVILSREEASIWIKRKHYKGTGGEAVIQWDAIATARSDAAEGKFTRWMTTLAFLEENGVDGEDLRDRIKNKTTTVERVLASSAMSSLLGVTFKNNTVSAEKGSTAELVSLLHPMMIAMGENSFKETVVSNVSQQEAWLRRFSAQALKKPANPTTPSPSTPTPTIGGTSPGKPGTSQPAPTGGATTSSPPSGTKPRPVPKQRSMLAKKGLRIRNANLNKFYQELTKLRVDTHPFAAAAVIRVFLEKATVVYLEAMSVPTLNKKLGATWHDFEIKLRSKVDAALKHVDPSESNPNLQYARQVANGATDALHSLDQLNRAIHDNTALPAASETIVIWDRFHDYFVALFDALEKAGK